MLKNYFKIAFRSFRKHLLYSGINIFGLAFSLAICFIVLGHISYEYSFEDFQENGDRIYKVEANYSYENDQYKTALLPPLLGKSILNDVSEIEAVSVIRVKQVNSIKINNERFRIIDPHKGEMHSHGNKLVFADKSYFKVFTFPLVIGNSTNALNDPFSLIISEKAAIKYFSGENPIGKSVILNDKYECYITGILKDTPYNTQLHTDFIISHNTLGKFEEPSNNWNRSGTDLIYILIKNNADPDLVASKIEVIKNNFFNPEQAANYSMYLMSFRELMFRGFPGARGDLNPRAEPSLIFGLAAVAMFILFLAIANFINLATARASERMKEVGVRKVMGAFRVQLVRQFLSESLIIVIISTILSLGLYEILKSLMASMVPRQMFVNFYNSPNMMIGVAILMIVVGFINGFYPALYLSRFKPITVLQSKVDIKSTKSLLRRSLVVFQFSIAAVFVFITFVTFKQNSMITSVDLGFERENVMLLPFDGPEAVKNCQLMKNEIINNTRILSATTASNAPGSDFYSYAFYTKPERLPEDRIVVKLIDIDYDFISAFGLELIQGRPFSPDHPEDINHGIIVNESAKDELKVDNLLGHQIYRKDGFYKIIGVVKNFHAAALNYAYHSTNVLRLQPQECKVLMLKLPGEDINETIATIEQIWAKTLPEEQFTYSFLDDEINKNYDELNQQAGMFTFLGIITIGIACLGIFGLVSFTAERKTKEIGIRKVMGASIKNIIIHLSKEFLILTAIATIIAWPIAYIMAIDFLQYYPYKVSLGIEIFLFTGFITIALALFSAGFKAFQAARMNLVDTLRYE